MAEKVAEKHEQEENILGTEKIGKLMLKFSIPSIISMVVNALYNIVDQIFIGRGVGYLGNGATNVVFPITVVAMALSFMIADGGAAYMSLKLGEKKKDEASKGVANAITMAVAVSILLFAIGMIFLPQLLNLFGCTDGLREYAMSYGRIIVMGLPFYIIGSALNGMIRAFPSFASSGVTETAERIEISTPCKYSSITTRFPASPKVPSVIKSSIALWAISKEEATTTPLPAASPSALITIGAPILST
jgi:hypothetical protein